MDWKKNHRLSGTLATVFFPLGEGWPLKQFLPLTETIDPLKLGQKAIKNSHNNRFCPPPLKKFLEESQANEFFSSFCKMLTVLMFAIFIMTNLAANELMNCLTNCARPLR